MTWSAWTSAEDAILSSAMTAGGGWLVIADRVGRPVTACRRRAQRLNLTLNNAGLRERMSVAVAAAWSPERRKMQSALIRSKRLWEAGSAVLSRNPDIIARRSQKQREVRAAWWSWCPPEYRDEYRMMYRIIGAKVARAYIDALIGRHKLEREKAAIDARLRGRTFAGAMAAFAAGEIVTLNVLPPVQRLDLMFSPIGCALA